MGTHYQGNEEEKRALNTFIKLTRATNSVMSYLSFAGTLGDLTISQFGVLETLYHLGPLPHCDISAKQLKSTGNMTLVIDNLEKRGLVERIRSTADRRVVMVNLTPKGEELISEMFPIHMRRIVEMMGALTAEEQEQLSLLAKKLGVSLTERMVESKLEN